MPARQFTDRQRAILTWVAQGCPERDWPDQSHKNSVRALANRDLVRISRPGGRWTAVLTKAGEHYHLHGEYPEGHRYRPKPQAPASATASAPPGPAKKQGKSKDAAEGPGNDWSIDSPKRLKRRARGALAKAPDNAPSHPWDDRVLISVKEAAWLLSVSEEMIRGAVRFGDVNRVFIGAGTKNYRIVYDSLLSWVNSMPTEPVHSRW